jgi:hypothetical protein
MPSKCITKSVPLSRPDPDYSHHKGLARQSRNQRKADHDHVHVHEDADVNVNVGVDVVVIGLSP